MKDKKYTFSHTILLTFCILILTLFSAIDVNAENESETAGASLGKPASYYEDNMVTVVGQRILGEKSMENGIILTPVDTG